MKQYKPTKKEKAYVKGIKKRLETAKWTSIIGCMAVMSPRGLLRAYKHVRAYKIDSTASGPNYMIIGTRDDLIIFTCDNRFTSAISKKYVRIIPPIII